MNKLVTLSSILFTIVLLSGFCIAQNPNQFTSGEGGFGIDLPREGVTVEDTPEDEAGLGVGKKYIWKMPDRVFVVAFYRMSEDKPLTPKLRSNVLLGFKEGFIKGVRKNNYQVTHKPFTYKGHPGGEFRTIYPAGVSVLRYFATLTRCYMLQTTLRGNAPEVESAAIKILGSFRILDAAELKKVKIEEATPEPLPQGRVDKKLKSDAEDVGLKGKIQSVVEDTLNLPGTRRERSNEKYFDSRGNLTKEITFSNDYPESVEIWGSIDGNRVSLWNGIEFDNDQRPPSKEIIMTMMESPRNPGTTPDTPTSLAIPLEEDLRYSTRYAYKYDEHGRRIEAALFGNDGKPSGRTTFTYNSDRLEERNYTGAEEEYGHTSYVMDSGRNIVEMIEYDENDKAVGSTVYKYEFDATGNWTVRRSFEKKTIRGKPVLKPVSITYRIITYYP
jgi:hypothetical protein